MAKTIFKRIIDGEIPANLVYEDDRCLAFRDINPQAPTHVLVIPRQEITGVSKSTTADEPLLGHLLVVAAQIAKQLKLDEGFRLVVNDGNHGGQTVDHLHVHLLGGRPLSWPPG